MQDGLSVLLCRVPVRRRHRWVDAISICPHHAHPPISDNLPLHHGCVPSGNPTPNHTDSQTWHTMYMMHRYGSGRDVTDNGQIIVGLSQSASSLTD